MKNKADVSVDEFVKDLEHPNKKGIETLRSLIKSVDSRICEGIKWNAPSYYIEGKDHFFTFKLHPPTSIQIVLHTGAKTKSNPKKFAIQDDHNLLKWPAKDRAVLTLASDTQIAAYKKEIISIFKSWLSQMYI